MTESEFLDAFRQYRWSAIWQDVSNDTEDSLRLALRACLLAGWWQEPYVARGLLARLRPSSLPVQIFLRALSLTCLGDAQAAPKAIAKLKRQHAPGWMADWLALEWAGRSCHFDEQARLLNAILNRRPSPADWPFVACLQSLEHTQADIEPLKNVMAQIGNIAPMAQVLAVRLGLYAHIDACEILRRIPPDNPAYAPALYRLASLLISLGQVREAILALDALALTGQIDKPLLNNWLGLSLSHPACWSELPIRAHHAAQLVPNNLQATGAIASYQLIHFWANGCYAEAYATVKQFHGFLELPELDSNRMNRIYFNYVLRLAVAWQINRHLYDVGGAKASLSVVGESHSLSPANAIFNWHGERSKAVSRFVMGIKMHHLAKAAFNQYKTCVQAHIESISPGSHLLFTIGEIDCHPDEGIWVAARKDKATLPVVIANTVGGYLAWLDANIAQGYFASVTLQGIPAPGYSLDGKRDPGDKAEFLAMIREVNVQLKRGALERGWNFLDVYAATVNEDGSGNEKWHLDGYHLTPIFYRTADQYLVKPTIGIDP